jgi:hypothetical protein
VVFLKGIILHLQKLAKVGFTFFRETICFQKDDDFFCQEVISRKFPDI